MPGNGNGQKPSAPLISLRRSFQLRPWEFMILGIGMWLVVGLLGLLRPVRLLAGSNTGWVYLTTALLLAPSILSYIELRNWIGHTGGSYRLIRAMERNPFTFFAGWAYVLGWTMLSALIAHTFSLYAGNMLTLLTGATVPAWVWVALLLFFFVVANLTARHVPWRLMMWLSAAVALGVVVLIVLLTAAMIKNGANIPPVRNAGQSFFAAVTALTAALWVVEMTGETGDRRQRNVTSGLLMLFLGPVLAGVLTLLARWLVPGVLAVEDIAAAMVPATGEAITLVAGTVAAAITWQMLSLLMLRRLQLIGLDGWMPSVLLRPFTRFKTPVLLILAQAALTPLGLWLTRAVAEMRGQAVSAPLLMAFVAGVTMLVLFAGVNLAAIVLARGERAEDRSFSLLLYPAVPASGMAINALLMFATPWKAMLLTGLWFALGALVYWQIGLERMRTSQLGVTVFQDTTRRPDATSPYPVVVPVANPETAHDLVDVGVEIAALHGGHVSVVEIVVVPEQRALDSRRLEARKELDLLERVVGGTGRYDVPIEGITRLARSIPQGILDTVAEESARMLVLGWNARDDRSTSGVGLGHILDEVIGDAPSDVVVMRGKWPEAPAHVLVPVAGGPHAPRAAEIALGLTRENGGRVTLLHVVRTSDEEDSFEKGEALLRGIVDELLDPDRVDVQVVRAASPLAGITEALKSHDAVMLGATEQGMLDRQLFGQFPLQLARATDKPLMLVRHYTGVAGLVARKAWSSLSNVLPTLNMQEQMEVYRRMQRAALPNVNYFVLIASSAMIATLGLLLNSPAVIIGAMLVAPLLSPFVAEAVGIVTGDINIIRNGLRAIFQGVLASIFIAVIATLISPLADATPEVLARTQPNLLDLMIAVVSGIAGAYAIARKEVGEALPGVAIAAALMPPLCSVGIGIALGDIAVALGAMLLFTTNLVSIVFGSAVVLLLLGMRPPHHPERQRRLRQGLTISIASLLLISIPLGIVLFRAVQQGRIENQARSVVDEVVAQVGEGRLADFTVDAGWRRVRINGTLYTSEPDHQIDIEALDSALEERLNRPVDIHLFTIQGTTLDSTDGGSSSITP